MNFLTCFGLIQMKYQYENQAKELNIKIIQLFKAQPAAHRPMVAQRAEKTYRSFASLCVKAGREKENIFREN